MKFNFKITFLLILLVTITHCCGTSKSMREKKHCKEVLKEFISDNWSYNSESKTFVETREMVNINRRGTGRQECLQLMNKADLIELFGEPSREDSNRMFYFYFEEDFDRFDSTRNCVYCMYIQLNDSGKVKSFGFPVMG